MSSTTSVVDPAQYESAVWPWLESSIRYDDPVAAARGFAEEFVGFESPVFGSFQQGDGRSGEVEVRPEAGGPVTTVIVRQLGPDDTWWVLGSATGNIVVSKPAALATIDSPLTVVGEALAFEGVVSVELRADGTKTPVADGTVIGGGAQLEPFEGEFTWLGQTEDAGALLLFSESMENGQVWEATVVRVIFDDESS